jgi:cold shock CspA family protein
MVQRDQGIWLHSAGRRRQGRVRAHLGRGESGYTGLAEGAKVSVDVVANRGKETAENLKIR